MLVPSAKPHRRVDKVMPPKKLVLALPTSTQEPTLSGRQSSNIHQRPKSCNPNFQKIFKIFILGKIKGYKCIVHRERIALRPKYYALSTLHLKIRIINFFDSN